MVRRMALLLVVAIAGCGGGDAAAPQVASGGGSSVFPTEDLGDWVSYADHVAVLRVTGERVHEPEMLEHEEGDGVQLRDVTVKVERVLWSARRAPELARELRFEALGWTFNDGVKQEWRLYDGARVDVGGRYLTALVRWPEKYGELGEPPHHWGPMHMDAQLPLDGDRVVSEADWSAPVLDALRGASVDEVVARLERARPDPRAAELADLPPVRRVRAVFNSPD